MLIKDPLECEPLGWTYKGISPEMDGITVEQVGGLGLSLFDDRVLFPVAILHDDAVRNNSDWMRRFLGITGAAIAPHGKTTMAPALFRQQVEDGAWAISAATVSHVRAYRAFGVSRVFLANQLVGAGAIEWVMGELRAHPDFDFYCLVDSARNVEELAISARHIGLERPLKVLIEVGRQGGRAGVRSVDEGLGLARRIAQLPNELQLVGIETFEGVFQMSAGGEIEATAMIDGVLDLARACDQCGLFQKQIILSAGGSAFFDIATRRLANSQLSLDTLVVIRSGCYLSHDDGMYQSLVSRLIERFPQAASLAPGLRPALQVWTQVQSRPEPSRLICAMGKRDVGTDVHPPKLVAWTRAGDTLARPAPPDHTVTGLNDHHTFLDCPPDSPIGTGDYVGFGVSHPCTTFDRWRLIFRVNAEFKISGALRTYF